MFLLGMTQIVDLNLLYYVEDSAMADNGPVNADQKDTRQSFTLGNALGVSHRPQSQKYSSHPQSLWRKLLPRTMRGSSAY